MNSKADLMSDRVQGAGAHPATDRLAPSDENPTYLRQRANRLRDVARGVYDPKALEELERFIVTLESQADQLGS